VIPWPILRRILFCLSAERAHDLTIAGLRAGLGPRVRIAPDPVLATQVWGKSFANPLGLAAGFDKDARVMAAMGALGFGFVEVGTLTPQPQPGNPRPRLFRLSEDRAVINRLGFNNGGAAAAAERLALFRARHGHAIVGVNIGRNKDSANAVADYAEAAYASGARVIGSCCGSTPEHTRAIAARLARHRG